MSKADASSTPPEKSRAALVLGGGGARAAYQVGVLAGLAEAIPDLPVRILTGVSAGAINATFLANSVARPVDALHELEQCWLSLTVDEVFDVGGLALGWRAAWNTLRLVLPLPQRGTIRSMVDTRPLRRFLHRVYGSADGRLPQITENVKSGRLRAFALTAAHYATGRGVTFFCSRDVEPWDRPLRRSVDTELRVDHVMASSALPVLFPAIPVDGCWYGDGGIGLVAPLSPAVHLGADRILVISTRYRPPAHERPPAQQEGPPSLATIAGALYNTVFLDQLDYDAMQLGRLTSCLRPLEQGDRNGLRPIGLHVIRPSEDMAVAAARFEHDLPHVLRHLTRRLGTGDTGRQDLLSTMMFVPSFARYLLDLGRRDAETHADAVSKLLRD